MYLTGGKNYISKDTVGVEWPEDVYGLTIVTDSIYDSTTPDYADYDAIKYYDNWLNFSSKWGKVIKGWRDLR